MTWWNFVGDGRYWIFCRLIKASNSFNRPFSCDYCENWFDVHNWSIVELWNWRFNRDFPSRNRNAKCLTHNINFIRSIHFISSSALVGKFWKFFLYSALFLPLKHIKRIELHSRRSLTMKNLKFALSLYSHHLTHIIADEYKMLNVNCEQKITNITKNLSFYERQQWQLGSSSTNTWIVAYSRYHLKRTVNM